jgi:hypothetical protein
LLTGRHSVPMEASEFTANDAYHSLR